MRKLFLTVLVIVFACNSNEQPEGLLQKEEMVKAMIEIHLLEAKIDELSFRPVDSVDLVYYHYEKLLFEELGITQDQYELSYNYYANHPSEFEKVYNVVVDSLMQREKLGK